MALVLLPGWCQVALRCQVRSISGFGMGEFHWAFSCHFYCFLKDVQKLVMYLFSKGQRDKSGLKNVILTGMMRNDLQNHTAMNAQTWNISLPYLSPHFSLFGAKSVLLKCLQNKENTRFSSKVGLMFNFFHDCDLTNVSYLHNKTLVEATHKQPNDVSVNNEVLATEQIPC